MGLHNVIELNVFHNELLRLEIAYNSTTAIVACCCTLLHSTESSNKWIYLWSLLPCRQWDNVLRIMVGPKRCRLLDMPRTMTSDKNFFGKIYATFWNFAQVPELYGTLHRVWWNGTNCEFASVWNLTGNLTNAVQRHWTYSFWCLTHSKAVAASTMYVGLCGSVCLLKDTCKMILREIIWLWY